MLVLVRILFTISSLFSTYSQGTLLYDDQLELCCDGTVRQLPDHEHDYGCCGKEIYNRTQLDDTLLVDICCRDKLYQQVSTTKFCCGTEAIEMTTQACYQRGEEFDVLPLSPDNNRENKTEVCGSSKGEGEFYNPEKEECCSDKVYKIEDNKECCGGLYINVTVAKCCTDYVQDEQTKKWTVEKTSVIEHNGNIPRNSECCNGEIFDINKQLCCEGVVANITYDKTKRSYKSVCCGTELMDPKTQYCDENERIESKEETQVYCVGKLHDVSGNEPLLVYCVNEKVLECKENEAICSVNGQYVKYDNEKQVCDSNELINKTAEDLAKFRSTACLKSSDKYPLYVQPALIYQPPFKASNFDDEFNVTYYSLD